jgi:hypothetical protein
MTKSSCFKEGFSSNPTTCIDDGETISLSNKVTSTDLQKHITDIPRKTNIHVAHQKAFAPNKNCANKCTRDKYLMDIYKGKTVDDIVNDMNNFDKKNIIKLENKCNNSCYDGLRCPCPNEINQIAKCPDRWDFDAGFDSTCKKNKIMVDGKEFSVEAPNNLKPVTCKKGNFNIKENDIFVAQQTQESTNNVSSSDLNNMNLLDLCKKAGFK